ncbi:MAG TPA: TerC family protein [Negativicutes bacterium]|nr:TerC family protein [Negativicutes bacterium]
MEFFGALLGIMMVNIVLSGDNAVVIALASRALPPKQQKMAILWGSAGAIGLRVVLTVVAVVLLHIPYVQFVGGVLLVWIAAKLLLEDEGGENIEASSSMWKAVKTIIVADLIMSLDNTLAIAAVAKGDYVLLALGLALSVPLIVFGSQIIVKIMDRFPIIVYAGAGLIAWTAGEMMQGDRLLAAYAEALPAWLLPALITVAVIAAGIWHKKHRKTSAAAAGEQADTHEQMN